MKLSVLLQILKVFGKNESAIRMSLSRAVKAGMLINSRHDNEVSYALTTEGKKAIVYWNEGVISFFERYHLRRAQWDHRWYFLNIDFKEEHREVKAEFLDKLQQRGFAKINTNTWVTPYYRNQEIWEIIETYGLSNDTVEIRGEMTIHKDLSEFLNEIYDIEKLRTGYQGFLDAYANRLQEIRQLCRDESFIQNGLAFPILHSLGFDFFEIASDDAVLPKELLPEWEGDRAAVILREARKPLLEATHKYLDQFNIL